MENNPLPNGGDPADAAERTDLNPYSLTRYLRRPDQQLEWLPLIDIMVIAMLFAVLFSRFVAVPGMAIELPASASTIRTEVGSVRVLTIGPAGQLFFDGSIYDARTVQRGFERFFERNPGADAVLLLRMDGSVAARELLEICERAARAGFRQVQILGAEDESPGEIPMFP